MRLAPLVIPLVILSGSLVACSARDPKRSPADATMALVEAMQRLDQSAYRARAFALLDRESREVLEVRARSAESLSHRPFVGADMLVPSPAILAFVPERVKSEDVSVRGDRATVTLRGKKAGEVARVALVREPDGWRVVLGLEREAPASRGPHVIAE